mmetsp:Transcript_7536/g.21418  ORF Transcript_7536/g.21418 Transcript_7536/m.21418 type:complete len:243 (+) Transcript_7536:1949-2677(+)
MVLWESRRHDHTAETVSQKVRPRAPGDQHESPGHGAVPESRAPGVTHKREPKRAERFEAPAPGHCPPPARRPPPPRKAEPRGIIRQRPGRCGCPPHKWARFDGPQGVLVAPERGPIAGTDGFHQFGSLRTAGATRQGPNHLRETANGCADTRGGDMERRVVLQRPGAAEPDLGDRCGLGEECCGGLRLRAHQPDWYWSGSHYGSGKARNIQGNFDDRGGGHGSIPNAKAQGTGHEAPICRQY